MPDKILERSIDILIENAGECADLAQAQLDAADKLHASASRQYENANKLKSVSDALMQDAAEIKYEMASESKTANPL